MRKKEFELLAPAGSFEILKAVIEAGADAVYVGGNRFGARAYANNFTEDELLNAIDYVHLRGRKLFLTINTLFKNQELEELYAYLLPFYERGLDAVIVQDIGAIAYIRKHFPDLPIHTSTQMTITGVEGAKLLKEAGAERVVLARELSISEMKTIREEADVELEVFIHGALCYSYSGQCLFSSVLGGRSGNRGRCAQPCRLPYTVCDAKKKEYTKESYVLSLKDLCGIEYLDQLRKAGVYSLKIEGRMKQASYAAGVVSYYRKYIDLEKQISNEDKKHLLELGNRCGFTSTYYKAHNGKDMITFEKPSYEKSNEALHQEIENKYVGNKSKLPIFGSLVLKKGLPMELTLFYTNCEDGVEEQVYSSYASGAEVSEAKNKPLSKEDVIARMKKTGDSSFVFTDIEVVMDDDVFAPNGALNQLRRDALEQLEQNLLASFMRQKQEKSYEENDKEKVSEFNQIPQLIASYESREQLEVLLNKSYITCIYGDSQAYTKNTFLVRLKEDVLAAHNNNKQFFYIMPAIFREHTAFYYSQNMEAILKTGVDGFVIKNYEELYFVNDYAKKNQITIPMIADHNMYSYNNAAVSELESSHIRRNTIPLELNKREIMKRNNLNSEMIVYGYYPLMTTAGCIHKNTTACDKQPGLVYLKDRYKTYFPAKNNCWDCYNVIYNSVPVLLWKEMDELKQYDIRHFRLSFTVETKKETYEVLEYLEGNGKEFPYTKGHYKRGVE